MNLTFCTGRQIFEQAALAGISLESMCNITSQDLTLILYF